MPASFYVVATVADMLLSVIQTLMMIRALMSWFPVRDDTPFFQFLYGVTEPFILPVRMLLEKLSLFQGLPIDVSFLITFLLLSFLQILI